MAVESLRRTSMQMQLIFEDFMKVDSALFSQIKDSKMDYQISHTLYPYTPITSVPLTTVSAFTCWCPWIRS